MQVSQFVTLDEVLKQAYASMQYADMTLDCSDGTIPIHRSVLAAASPFLRPILREYNAVESNRIIVPDVSMNTMKEVISLMYTGKAISADVEHLQEIAAAANMLGVELNSSWEIVNVVVVNAGNPKPVTPIEPERPPLAVPKPDPCDDDDVIEVEVVEEVRSAPPPAPKRKPEVPVSRPRSPTPPPPARSPTPPPPPREPTPPPPPPKSPTPPPPQAQNTAPPAKKPRAPRKRACTNTNTSTRTSHVPVETAAFIAEMLESGHLQLTLGPTQTQRFGFGQQARRSDSDNGSGRSSPNSSTGAQSSSKNGDQQFRTTNPLPFRIPDVPPVRLSNGKLIRFSNGQPIEVKEGELDRDINEPPARIISGRPIRISNGQPIEISTGQPIRINRGQPNGVNGGQQFRIIGGQSIRVATDVSQEQPLNSGEQVARVGDGQRPRFIYDSNGIINVNRDLGISPDVRASTAAPSSQPRFQNIAFMANENASQRFQLARDDEMDEDEPLSQAEIQEAYLVASQKDHAYAHDRDGRGRGRFGNIRASGGVGSSAGGYC